MALKTDRSEVDRTELPDGQQTDYLVLSDLERSKGFVRPLRAQYRHLTCNAEISMPEKIAETYAADPGFYGKTFCVHCMGHFPVGAGGEFVWLDGSKVGT